MNTLHHNQVSLIPEIYAATCCANEDTQSAKNFLTQAESRFGDAPLQEPPTYTI